MRGHSTVQEIGNDARTQNRFSLDRINGPQHRTHQLDRSTGWSQQRREHLRRRYERDVYTRMCVGNLRLLTRLLTNSSASLIQSG